MLLFAFFRHAPAADMLLLMMAADAADADFSFAITPFLPPALLRRADFRFRHADAYAGAMMLLFFSLFAFLFDFFITLPADVVMLAC